MFFQGKKFPKNCTEGSGEDEGCGLVKEDKQRARALIVSRELSDLVSLLRTKFVDFAISQQVCKK
jgi:hypothetical protein